MARILRTGSFYLGLFLCSLFAIFPGIWMVISIFKKSSDLYSTGHNPFLYHPGPTLSHAIYLFTQTHFPTFVLNSAIIGGCVVGITILLAVPAAYALARLTGHWGERSGMVLFLVYLIPPSLLFLPMYQLVSFLGLANTIWGLAIVYPTITVPFCTWLLLGFFRSVPRELDEAAMIDGCSRFRAFLRIVLPLTLPGIAACIVFAFSLQLSDYIYAATFVTSSSAMTISFGVPTELIRGDVFFWQGLMAADAVVSIPLMLAYGLLFDKLVAGFQSAETAAAGG
ncbi:MAG TPA: carbohydrate ABC transporter permease [Gammaproteobacteria bacterium]|nr:carbohydrate ABC transporter permease [Gammaproteobacteria bacterium]HYW93291.1 carbohydrate ABC transporter permease [Gammaproteobacteria bacterium]